MLHAEAAVSDGRSAYRQHCASCHGADFQGGFGPALKGAAFVAKWKDPAALRSFIVANMPPGNPDALSPAAAGAVTSLLLGKGEGGGAGSGGRVTAKNSEPTPASASANEGGGILQSSPNFDAPYLAALAARQKRLAAITPVTDAMLADPPSGDWLHWRRTYDGHGFSPLKSIDRQNVGKLQLAWSLALRVGTNGINPLAHDGVLFVNSSGTISALDTRTGDVLWQFSREAVASTMGPPITQPRGMALYGDKLFVPTLDNHLIALDVRTGKPIWDHLIDPSSGSLRVTGAPLVMRGKVVLGMSGCAGNGEPKGCFIAAFDAQTGQEAWRFYTVARPGEPGGDTWNGAPMERRFGASLWTGGTYDPATNLLFFGTGQTYQITPLMEERGGGGSRDALYTDTTLALDPDTGRLVWHYQHMARDVWDMDWAFERQIVDIQTPAGPQHALVTIGKLGILDALDARSGRYLFSMDMGYQNLVKSIDPNTGRKITDPALEPRTDRPISVCPFATGVRNWPATSYDAANHRLYVPFANSCMDLIWQKGADFDISYGVKPPEGGDRNFGGLAALDLTGRKTMWSARQRAPASASALATAGGVIFHGGRDRVFRATDAVTRKLLWSAVLDGVPSSTPISFLADGVQYVAVTTGGGNPDEATMRPLTPEIEPVGPGVRLWLYRRPSPR